MQKLNYPLKSYIKAVEKLAICKGFVKVENSDKRGSAVRFEPFIKNEVKPHSMWVVHTDHTKMRRITSTEDYKKVARNLNSTLEEFLEIIKQC